MKVLEQSLQKRASEVFDFAQAQVRAQIERDPGFYPMYTENGLWRHDKPSWTRWCDGFLPGMMWIFARRTGDGYWVDRAEEWSRPLEDRQHDRDVHDLGFVFWSTYKRWFDLTGDGALNQVVTTAGTTMGHRFNEAGKYLRSFVSPESCFIDIMMNIGIMFYAAQQSFNDDLLRKVTEHCLTSRRYLVRGDGSTSHEGIFNIESGEFLRQTTHQGWRDDSSWARGQAWAIYGFGTAYRFTYDPRFLDVAERCADFYIVRTDDSGVPPNDWEEPHPLRPWESSAAAITASGLFQLAQLTNSQERAVGYRHYALTIMNTLLSHEFVADTTPGWQGILKHGSYHERLGLGVDESVMWGEYFFVEAVDKLLGAPSIQ
ncbi:MAG TPA: glycoside hydrolase family 88 protein [Thermomicrobiales bacterium]|nr:glycoside hydrolase family 88 protein [Thermomicrobiales bacterium]